MAKLNFRYEIRIGTEEAEAIKKLKTAGEDVPELIRNFLTERAKPETMKKIKEEKKEQIKAIKKEKEKKYIKDKIKRMELTGKSKTTEIGIIKTALKLFQERATEEEKKTSDYINKVKSFENSIQNLKNEREELRGKIKEMEKEVL